MKAGVVRLAVALLGIGLLLGCAKDNPLNRQGVSGTVKFKGEPVAKGTIRFIPVAGNQTVSGGNIENGTYAVASEKGLAPGEYTVNINIPDPNWVRDAITSPAPTDLAPADWSTGAAHKVTIKEGDNVFDFDLGSP